MHSPSCQTPKAKKREKKSNWRIPNGPDDSLKKENSLFLVSKMPKKTNRIKNDLAMSAHDLITSKIEENSLSALPFILLFPFFKETKETPDIKIQSEIIQPHFLRIEIFSVNVFMFKLSHK